MADIEYNVCRLAGGSVIEKQEHKKTRREECENRAQARHRLIDESQHDQSPLNPQHSQSDRDMGLLDAPSHERTEINRERIEPCEKNVAASLSSVL